MQNIHALLQLASVPKIGSQRIRALLSHFKSAEEALKATPRDFIKVPGINKKIALSIAHHTGGEKFADEQLKKLNRVGGHILTIWDQDYPELLKAIYDPPTLLFILGKLKNEDRRSLAIVGTRHPSPYGQAMTEHFVQRFAEQRLTIVSGLARGIDTIAHQTALKNNMRTIAVIGSGLDVPYPPENKKLMEQIAEHGAVLTEFFMGTKPDAPNFPRRNRIVSGLSLGTIVTESDENGGAMITASLALDQDREVFAIPGNISEKRSSGPNKLIREGRAKLITGPQDVYDELQQQLHLSLSQNPVHPPVNLSTPEKTILSFLSGNPLHIDLLAEQAASTTSDVLVTLLSLEFKGQVRQLPGKMFMRL
jgi:DNA processing protein